MSSTESDFWPRSHVADEFFNQVKTIAKAGAADALADVVRSQRAQIAELREQLRSAQLRHLGELAVKDQAMTDLRCELISARSKLKAHGLLCDPPRSSPT